MGKVASQMSDLAVVTSDNPRFEDPELIISDVVAGIEKTNYLQITDRKKAINKILNEMDFSKDVVLIAGKGHEDYQEIKGKKYPFSDSVVASDVLKRRS